MKHFLKNLPLAFRTSSIYLKFAITRKGGRVLNQGLSSYQINGKLFSMPRALTLLLLLPQLVWIHFREI